MTSTQARIYFADNSMLVICFWKSKLSSISIWFCGRAELKRALEYRYSIRGKF